MSIRGHEALFFVLLAIAACDARSAEVTAAQVNEEIAKANAADKRYAESLPFDYRDLVRDLLVEYLHSLSLPGKGHQYFVGVFGGDVDAALTAKLHASGIEVRPASAWSFPDGKQVRSSPNVRITVGEMRQLTPDTFTIRIGYYCGTLCAGSETCKLQKDGERWRIIDRQQDWIA
jgi:hypothetical protein